MTLPTVTQVLGQYADFSRVPEAVLEAACVRGTEVHLACTNLAQGVWSPVSSEYLGYFESFARWFDKYADMIYLVETRLKNEAIGFTGQPDFILSLRGSKSPCLVDLKTSAAPQPLWSLQLSTYWALAEHNGFEVARCFSLRLKADGSRPAIREYTDSWRENYTVFLSALNVYRFMHKGE